MVVVVVATVENLQRRVLTIQNTENRANSFYLTTRRERERPRTVHSMSCSFATALRSFSWRGCAMEAVAPMVLSVVGGQWLLFCYVLFLIICSDWQRQPAHSSVYCTDWREHSLQVWTILFFTLLSLWKNIYRYIMNWRNEMKAVRNLKRKTNVVIYLIKLFQGDEVSGTNATAETNSNAIPNAKCLLRYAIHAIPTTVYSWTAIIHKLAATCTYQYVSFVCWFAWFSGFRVHGCFHASHGFLILACSGLPWVAITGLLSQWWSIRSHGTDGTVHAGC